MVVCFARGSHRGWLFAFAFDRLGNVLSGGTDEEYLSQRANRLQKEGRTWACLLCKMLDRVQQGHCALYDKPVGERKTALELYQTSN